MTESVGDFHWIFIALLLVLYTFVMILTVVTAWKIFTRAQQPGWGAFIPIYNTYLLTLIANRPFVWFLLALVPCISPIVTLILLIDLYRAFDRPAWAIFVPIYGFIVALQMAFGDAVYRKPLRA